MIKSTKIKALLLSFLVPFFSTYVHAGFNPFNKDKTLRFGDDTPWRTTKTGTIKSGMDKNRGNSFFYHLSISNDLLKLQLSKNEPDPLANKPWDIEAFDVLDINIDGITLPQFQWCLENRDNPDAFPALTMNTRVQNDVCSVDIGKGSFIIRLNKNNLLAIRQAGKLQIVIRLDKYLTTLNYNMNGFESALDGYNKQLAAIKARNEQANKPRPRSCFVKAPGDYGKIIKPVSYTCDNKAEQDKAVKTVNARIASHKRKQKEAMQKRKRLAEQKRKQQLEQQRLAELEKARREEQRRKELREQQERDRKWGKIESSRWLDRCKQKWAQGVSPCYCQSYLKELSPQGVKNTCRN